MPLEKAESSEKKKILRLMHSNGNDRKRMTEIRSFINKYKGLEYAGSKMTEYTESALQKLESILKMRSGAHSSNL